jgi:hypothetical protein
MERTCVQCGQKLPPQPKYTVIIKISANVPGGVLSESITMTMDDFLVAGETIEKVASNYKELSHRIVLKMIEQGRG